MGSGGEEMPGVADGESELEAARAHLAGLIRQRAKQECEEEQGVGKVLGNQADRVNQEQAGADAGAAPGEGAPGQPAAEALAPEADAVSEMDNTAAEPVERYSRPPARAELRGEVFDARTPGHPWEKSIGGLLVAEDTRRVFRQPLPDDETEGLLNAIIGELHYNMREIAFRSMCHATQLDQRMQWIDASIKTAEAGARVGETVAHIRGAPIDGRRARSRAKE